MHHAGMGGQDLVWVSSSPGQAVASVCDIGCASQPCFTSEFMFAHTVPCAEDSGAQDPSCVGHIDAQAEKGHGSLAFIPSEMRGASLHGALEQADEGEGCWEDAMPRSVQLAFAVDSTAGHALAYIVLSPHIPDNLLEIYLTSSKTWDVASPEPAAGVYCDDSKHFIPFDGLLDFFSKPKLSNSHSRLHCYRLHIASFLSQSTMSRTTID